MTLGFPETPLVFIVASRGAGPHQHLCQELPQELGVAPLGLDQGVIYSIE